MIKYSTVKVISVRDWDDLVKETYGKPYSFQQQNGCQERGNYHLEVDPNIIENDGCNDSIPEEINGDEMGIKFEVWLNTDPNIHKERNSWDDRRVELFWERNFYPDIEIIAADLCKKGLIKKGSYTIDIDW